MSAESSAAGYDHPPTVEVGAVTGSASGRGTWLGDVILQLDAIRKLPRGWDSYGGEAIDSEIVAAADKLAKSLARFPDVSRPHVSPTSAGGVQLEWEAKDGYFEVHFDEPSKARCYFERESPPSEEEFMFRDGDDISIFAQYASRTGGA